MDSIKKLHIKSLIQNYLVELMKADTENKYKETIVELSTLIHLI